MVVQDMPVTELSDPSFVATYLVSPKLRIPVKKLGAIDEVTAREIYGILKENKVLLRTLDSLFNPGYDISKKTILEALISKYRPFVEAQEAALRLRREILELASSFQRHNIDLFFIKSFSSLPLDSDNFDILVNEKDVARVRVVLADLGFVEIVWEKEPYKYLFRRVRNGEDYFAVHLHTRVAWEGHEFVDIDSLWEKRREIKVEDFSVFMPSASHHLLITLAHAFFENRNFSLSDAAYIFESVEEVDWLYVMGCVASDGWSEPFEALLLLANHISYITFGSNILPDEILLSAKTRPNSLVKMCLREYDPKHLQLQISTTLALTYYIRKIFSNRDKRWSEKVGATLSLLKRGVSRRAPLGAKQPPFLVCFSGVDASGKTTHAVSLWNRLQEKDTARAYYMWSRGFGQSFEPVLYPFRRFLSSKPEDNYKYEIRHAKIQRYDPLKKLWAHLILIDHVIQVMSRVKIHLLLGDLVICDRYIQDTYVDARCEVGTEIGKLVQKMTEQLVPKPDVILYLDATAKEIGRRRPRAGIAEIECKRLGYLDSYQGQRVATTINVGDSLQQNQKKILDIVLKSYYSTPSRKNYYSSDRGWIGND